MGRMGCPLTSLPNPRWGERVDAAEAARLRRRRQECDGGGTMVAVRNIQVGNDGKQMRNILDIIPAFDHPTLMTNGVVGYEIK